MQTASGEVNLEKWNAYAKVYLKRGIKGDICETGIIGVKNEQRCIRGLLEFRVSMTLHWGSPLVCEHLIILHLVNAEPFITTITEEMKSLFRDFKCEAIHVTGLKAYPTARTIPPACC